MTHRLTFLLAAALAATLGFARPAARRARRRNADGKARHREFREQLRAGNARGLQSRRRVAALVRVPPRDRGLHRRALERRALRDRVLGHRAVVLGKSICRRALAGRAGRRARGRRERAGDRLAERPRARVHRGRRRAVRRLRDRVAARADPCARARNGRGRACESARHRSADLLRARREPNGVAGRSRPMRRSFALRGFSSRCTPSIRTIRASRTTSFMRTTIRRSPPARWPPHAATRRSRRPRRTLCTCRRTRSRASALGKNRPRPIVCRSSPPCRTVSRPKRCTRWTIRPTPICKWRKIARRATCSIVCRRSRHCSIRRRRRAGRRRRWPASMRSPPSRRATRSSAARGKTPPRSRFRPAARRSRSR